MPATSRTPVKNLKPLDILYAFAANSVGARAEPPREELVADLKAGRQPYPGVVIGGTLVYALELFTAAKQIGVPDIETRECDGQEGLTPADYGLMAGGLHLRAVLQRLQPDPFETDLVRAGVYELWVQNMERKRPRKQSAEQRKERERVRKELIEREFGCPARTLQRHVIVSHLAPELRDAVRHNRLPVRAVTTALQNLPAAKQKELAARLADGVAFADLEEEYLGPRGKGKKTAGGKLRAILGAITTLVEEGRTLGDRSTLRPEDCPDAHDAATLLLQWIANPVQPANLDALVREFGAKFGRGGGAGVKAATRGGRGVKGGAA